VKVGEMDVTGVVVDNAVPRIDHLKTAVKLKLARNSKRLIVVQSSSEIPSQARRFPLSSF
jgi:hypothetical protein